MIAWDLVGFDGYMPYEPERSEMGLGRIRVKGGRTLYEAADNTGGQLVKLQRLEAIATPNGPRLKVYRRYIDPDTEMEFVPDQPVKRLT